MTPNLEPKPIEPLDPVAARMILAAMPVPIREAVEWRVASIDYRIEAVLAMAIAGFLDGECLNFSDCQPRPEMDSSHDQDDRSPNSIKVVHS